ncbi:hypothetical protein FHR32_005069 [Streptosporangium album]|uniref:Uncharacterized protein n=1 Tax=Streptosporangium album TaxID=47479 RepID=A0A7W7WAQ8_9ACTN|nr:hypothetical protein [Streptosporangium album]MBB4940692.1 hypothetical protein [Streptosporangium album]
MRPEARVWRKAARAEIKGVPRGRRSTHQAKTQQPQAPADESEQTTAASLTPAEQIEVHA